MLPDTLSNFFYENKELHKYEAREQGKYEWINTFTTRKGCHSEISQNIANSQDRNVYILPTHFWLVKNKISNYLNENSIILTKS